MSEISKVYLIQAPVSAVWQALIDPVQIAEWTDATAVMRAEEGFDFSLWAGDIWGKNTKVVVEKTLEQDWYGGEWDEPSKVVINLSAEGEGTKVELKHTEFPEAEKDDFAEGWDDYYFGAIKQYLESK